MNKFKSWGVFIKKAKKNTGKLQDKETHQKYKEECKMWITFGRKRERGKTPLVVKMKGNAQEGRQLKVTQVLQHQPTLPLVHLQAQDKHHSRHLLGNKLLDSQCWFSLFSGSVGFRYVNSTQWVPSGVCSFKNHEIDFPLTVYVYSEEVEVVTEVEQKGYWYIKIRKKRILLVFGILMEGRMVHFYIYECETKIVSF